MLGFDLKIKEFCQNVIQPKIDAGGLIPQMPQKLFYFMLAHQMK